VPGLTVLEVAHIERSKLVDVLAGNATTSRPARLYGLRGSNGHKYTHTCKLAPSTTVIRNRERDDQRSDTRQTWRIMQAMAREDIRIVHANGGWQVMTPGAKTSAPRVFKTKKDAISYALTTTRSSRVASKLPRATSTRTASSVAGKKNHGIREVVAKERKPAAKTIRKSAVKSRSSKNEESSLARLANRAKVEYDRNEVPGGAFRKLLNNAANTNKAALDRLAQ
jgi:hypothetical protein